MSLNYETRSPVRVLVVDDSAFMRTALSRMIASESDLEVVGTACGGSEALAKIAALDPDVVTLDVQMPGLDGLETLRCIMAQFPRPVIMVSAVTERDAEATLTALSCGAFDYVPKQMSSVSLEILHIRDDLIAKIRAAAQTRPRLALPARKPPRPSAIEYPWLLPVGPAIVAIGASTGGPRALETILPMFPCDFHVPILIVQHMPPGFTGPFAERLNSQCSISVREAVPNEAVQPGVAYIAPARLHIRVDRDFDSRVCLLLDPDPGNQLHVPSVDVMMKSVARTYRSLAMGVILTGMGSDGAEGMNEIHRQGGLTIGQNESTCAVYGMPRACAEQGSLARIVPLTRIPAEILKATRYRKHA